MSCAVGHRLGLDPMLLWLWRRPAATATIRPLAWEPPYASGVALEKQKDLKKKKKKRNWSLVAPNMDSQLYNLLGLWPEQDTGELWASAFQLWNGVKSYLSHKALMRFKWHCVYRGSGILLDPQKPQQILLISYLSVMSPSSKCTHMLSSWAYMILPLFLKCSYFPTKALPCLIYFFLVALHWKNVP